MNLKQRLIALERHESRDDGKGCPSCRQLEPRRQCGGLVLFAATDRLNDTQDCARPTIYLPERGAIER